MQSHSSGGFIYRNHCLSFFNYNLKNPVKHTVVHMAAAPLYRAVYSYRIPSGILLGNRGTEEVPLTQQLLMTAGWRFVLITIFFSSHY